MHYIKGKRGYTIAMILIPLISLLLVFGFFFLPILADLTGLQETTYFEKNFLTREMSTIITGLYASPGNTIVNYVRDTLWFSYEFTQEEVTSFDETTTLTSKTKYSIITGTLNINPVTLNPKFESEIKSEETLKEKVIPIFTKIGNNIVVDNKQITNQNINCESPNLPDLKGKTILIDAGHGGVDNGAEANNLKEKDITGAIGLSLYQSITNPKFFTRENIRKTVAEQTVNTNYRNKNEIAKEIAQNNIDIIISIHTGNYDDNSNNIKAHYSIESNKNIQEQSKSLACEILRELSNEKELELTGSSIIGIYPEDYNGAEILVNNKIAILLEIGNINSIKSSDKLKDPSITNRISTSIKRGLT
jgi:N-acetylmuramoyl-L-alanine amidase